MGRTREDAGYDERRWGFERYFDASSRRLVYRGAAADAEFWDRRWLESEPPAYSGPISRRGLVVRETTRLLEPGTLILEGGCGLALNSWRLTRLGYRTLALDYAVGTLCQVVGRAREVKPLAGDVGRLPLPDDSVDGYWSLGVIEHFYDGYERIRDEMRRVVRPGGYLFLTFPALNPLRRAKGRLGLYRPWTPRPADLELFYQFALPAERVIDDFEGHGFRLVRTVPYLGVSGLCEEMGAAGRWLNARLAGRGRPVRLLRSAVDVLARPFSYHGRLLVLHRSANRGGRAPNEAPRLSGQ